MSRSAWALAAVLLAGAALAGGKALADFESTDRRTDQDKVRDKVEEQALRYLGRTPAAGLVYAYKAADIARQIGEAGVEAQDRTLNARLVAQADDITLLKTLHAAGIDLRHDPVAQAIKHHLEGTAAKMSAEGLSDTDFVLMSVIQHPAYAVGKVAVGQAVEAAVGRVAERYGGKWGKRVADKLSQAAGDLVDQGWPLLAERADQADLTVAAYQKAAQRELESPARIAAEAEKAVLDGLPAEIAEAHLVPALASPDPAVARRALVLATIQPIPAQAETLPPPIAIPPHVIPAAPAQPLFFPAPARVALPPLQVRPVLPPPEPMLPPPVSNRDLLYRTIERENRLERAPPPPQRTDNPAPAREPTFWEMHPQLKEEMDCQGVRRAGCEKYNSSSGGDGGAVNYRGNFHATRNN